MFHRLHEKCFIHATHVSLVMFPMLLSHVYACDHVWLMQVVDIWSLKHLRHTWDEKWNNVHVHDLA
jgi:hypothetical protein